MRVAFTISRPIEFAPLFRGTLTALALAVGTACGSGGEDSKPHGDEAGASNTQGGRQDGTETHDAIGGDATEPTAEAGTAGSPGSHVNGTAGGATSVGGGNTGGSQHAAAGQDNATGGAGGSPTDGSSSGGTSGAAPSGSAGAAGAPAPDEGGGRLIESVPRPLGCTADGWCWSNPSPIGWDLRAVWVTAEDDVWAAGERGAIIHFDGQNWTQTSQTTTYDWLGLWASGPDDVWAVGSISAIVHFDGKVWRDYSVPEIVSLFTVWGSGPKDVWAAGLDGALYHFNGSVWTPWAVGTEAHLLSLWGSAKDDVWLGTSEGFLHFDGLRWNAVASPTGQGGRATWGSASNDIWSAYSEAVLHYDGQQWTDMAVPLNSVQSVSGMWIDADGAAWTTVGFPGQETVLARYAEGAWSSVSLGMDDLPVGRVMGSAGGPMWIVGPRGTLIRFGGQSFDNLTTGVNPELHFDSLVAFASDDVWASGDQLYHNTGSGWVAHELAPLLDAPGFLWGASPDDLWTFDSDGAVDRLDPSTSTWTRDVSIPNTTHVSPQGAWGTVDDLWLAGYWTSGHRVNGAWEDPFGIANYMDVYGVAPDDVWLVGADRCWAHWDGQRRESLCTGGSDDIEYRSVWGSAHDDFWLVGNRGVIYHYDGTEWTSADSGTFTYLNEVWGSGAEDVWVAGDEGLILHWQGDGWTPSESGTDRNLTYITGSSASDVWASGFEGTILHRTQSYRP